MILFAAHDPGAKNHISPIYEQALTAGEASEFIDLASSPELMDDRKASRLVRALRPELFIAGCSANQAEWGLIRACTGEGVKSAVMLDIGVGRKLDDISYIEFPDRFMVTNRGCVEELIGCGACRDNVVVTGSAHLETLSDRKIGMASDQIKRWYGIEDDSNIVPFFTSPNTDDSIDALNSLTSVIPKTPLSHPTLVIRPHPRTAQMERLEDACRQLQHVHYDPGDQIHRYDLLRASSFSLAMSSTVSLESLVLGTPSAFYQIGWDFNQLDRMYRNVEAVSRLRNPAQLDEFVKSVMDEEFVFVLDDTEFSNGASDRIWQVISDLRDQPKT